MYVTKHLEMATTMINGFWGLITDQQIRFSSSQRSSV